MDLGEFYEKHKQYYYWKLSRNISGTGLAFHAEDIIHDVVVNMIADEKQRTKFEGLTEPEANDMRKGWKQRAAAQKQL